MYSLRTENEKSKLIFIDYVRNIIFIIFIICKIFLIKIETLITQVLLSINPHPGTSSAAKAFTRWN